MGKRIRPKVMSALPLKADMCGAVADVCYGPKADIVKGIRDNKNPRAFARGLIGHKIKSA
jgi:hypothetical protein